MRQTPLYDEHLTAGGKAVDFHGWALPVQYQGILQEHSHTREKVSLFDCGHMGEFRVRGPEAQAAYDAVVISDVAGIKTGRGRYGALLSEQAGIIDDLITMRVSDDELYVVTNAGNHDEVSKILTSCASDIEDVSDETAKIDVQGPLARDTLLSIGLDMAGELKYFGMGTTEWQGTEIVLSRTGYTGELGYELFIPNAVAPALWQALIALDDVEPAGLGARDTLRTEMGYPLSGQDLDESRTPLGADMGFFVHWDGTFTGKEALCAQRDQGGHTVLAAVRTENRRAPRHGFEVYNGDAVVGVVTSGTFGPSVGYGIGLAYLRPELAPPGTALTAGPRGLAIETVERPFYSGGTCRA